MIKGKSSGQCVTVRTFSHIAIPFLFLVVTKDSYICTTIMVALYVDLSFFHDF